MYVGDKPTNGGYVKKSPADCVKLPIFSSSYFAVIDNEEHNHKDMLTLKECLDPNKSEEFIQNINNLLGKSKYLKSQYKNNTSQLSLTDNSDELRKIGEKVLNDYKFVIKSEIKEKFKASRNTATYFLVPEVNKLLCNRKNIFTTEEFEQLKSEIMTWNMNKKS